MNKLLLVLLAICLVSVHAFVKRDAPATETNYMKDFQELGESMTKQIQDAMKPEQIKKNLNELVDKVNSVFNPNAEKPK